MKAEARARRRPGRPTKFTHELASRIIGAIRIGVNVETAAAYAGINLDTYYRWLREGARMGRPQRPRPPKLDADGRPLITTLWQFSEAIEKAIAEAELRDLRVVDKAAAEGTWQAAAWKLERRYPHKYGQPATRINVEQRLSAQVVSVNAGPLSLSALTAEELDALDRLTQKVLDVGPAAAPAGSPALPRPGREGET